MKNYEAFTRMLEEVYRPGLIQNFGGQDFIATSILESIVQSIQSGATAAPTVAEVTNGEVSE